MPLTTDSSGGCKKTDATRPLYSVLAAVRLRRQFPFLLRGLPRRRVVATTEQIGGCAAICGILRDGKGEAHAEAACRYFSAFLLRMPGPQREEQAMFSPLRRAKRCTSQPF